MIDRYDHRGRLLDEPDDVDEPLSCHCGAALPDQPQESRRLVGYPDEKPFTEVLVWRRCPACGAEHSEQGYYED